MGLDHNLILASRVENAAVFNDEGWLIGHIKDLSIDRETGEVVYAILSFGGLLGIGACLYPLPWSVLNYDPERHGYITSLDIRALKDAPHYEASELEGLGGPHHVDTKQEIHTYYERHGAAS